MHRSLARHSVVLLGVGHTNAHVVRMWRMQPIPDAQLICVSNFPGVTYSGMLPGVLAGLYPPERMQIDLVRLCAAVGARLIVDEVTGLDVRERRLLFRDRPPLPFDVLSIGIGSTPARNGVEVEGDALVPIKPMQTLLDRLHARLDAWRAGPRDRALQIAVVGGGAGGVEVTFCLPERVRRVLGDAPFELHLIQADDTLIPGVLEKTSRLAEKELRRRGVRIHLNRKAVRIDSAGVTLDDGAEIPADVVVWATGAAPPPLVSRLNLPRADDGFLQTRPTLQTTADAPVFIVGDTGTRLDDPTPKAGVYAVRQGPVLWDNIRRMLESRPLEEYEPQRGFLKLFNTGDGRAIGEYKGFTTHSRWAWKLKDFIDGRFMDKYQDYEPMPMGGATRNRSAVPLAGRAGQARRLNMRDSADQSSAVPAMKCAGCGGKLGGAVLARVLRRLDVPGDANVLIGLNSPDDAALLKSPQSGRTVVTTDFFTAPLDDPWLVGRIAALNAASDAFAMGAAPRAALALATIPEGPRDQQEETLYQLLAGGLRELHAMGCTLVGGHTIEGPQLMIGYTILAELIAEEPCVKSAFRPGDVLLLTRPLGTGILLAAHMRADCPADAMTALQQSMLAGNQAAARLAVEQGVRAMTDVTGFGLAGHLLEALRASDVAAEIDLAAVPLLPGVAELIREGIESTLAPANRDVEAEMICPDALCNSPEYAALFDPQTSGGLLIAIAEDRADVLRERIHNATGSDPAAIGRLLPHRPDEPRIRLLNAQRANA